MHACIAQSHSHLHSMYYVVNTLYWPHTALSVYLVCYFLVPHTHVLCMGSGSATGKKNQVRLVHYLLKYFFKFQLWYWIKNLHYQIFKFVIDNSDISLNCLQHIQKRRNFDAKVTCHQPICLLLHAILSGVGVISFSVIELEVTPKARYGTTFKTNVKSVPPDAPRSAFINWSYANNIIWFCDFLPKLSPRFILTIKGVSPSIWCIFIDCLHDLRIGHYCMRMWCRVVYERRFLTKLKKFI